MPARKRHDPPQKDTPIDGGEITDDMTAGKDPDRHYVYVNPVALAGHDAIADYENRGYVQEEYRADGPRPMNSRRGASGVITSAGQVLMSCPLSEYERRAKRGQMLASEFDKRVLSAGGLDDGFRGGPGATVRAMAGRDEDVDSALGRDF